MRSVVFDTQKDFDAHYRIDGDGYTYDGMMAIARHRARLLIDEVPEILGSTILNVGSGIGCLSDILVSHGCEVVDVDKSPWISQERPGTLHLDVLTNDYFLLKNFGVFDFMLSENVLSGLSDSDLSAVSRISPRLAKRGVHIVCLNAIHPFKKRSLGEYHALFPKDHFVIVGGHDG